MALKICIFICNTDIIWYNISGGGVIMLKRKFYDRLIEWKNNKNQSCLLVKGARLIGKTYIIDYFGKNNYASYNLYQFY